MALLKPKLAGRADMARVSVSVTRDDNGQLTFERSMGGLTTAIASLPNDPKRTIWVGWPGIATDDLKPGEQKLISLKLKKQGYVPVFLSREHVKNFYEGYSNDTIWPMFHYFLSYAQFNTEYWRAYQEVNELFAHEVAKVSNPQTSFWVHDYHLMLLPQLLRNVLPHATIGFFLHIPFPSYEIFRLMPNRKELLEGLLGSDLIGFHVYDYGRHFLSSVLRIMGLESHHGAILLPERTVVVDVFPIGIDYEAFKQLGSNKLVTSELSALEEHYKRRKIILSYDRLDYSKGILKRLEAYKQLLDSYPDYRKKVVMIVIAGPSRTEVETYKNLRETLEQEVSAINGMYGTVDWTPIVYQFQSLQFEKIAALLIRSDVALVTPLRDGMNLIAKEFVASKQKRPGVLILSEMAGAIDELQEALRVNPNDIVLMTQALRTALTMPKSDQWQRLASMQARISSYTVQRWAADFIEQLSRSKALGISHQAKDLPDTAKKRLISEFKNADGRLIILDYDGTMRDLVASHKPSLATPPPELIRLLQKLITVPRIKVGIISGRPREVMEKWFGKLDLSLAAEHGAWVKENRQWSQAQVSMQKYKKMILPILARYAERTPGAVIEEKKFALVWHYRGVVPELAYVRNSSLKHELNQVLAGTDIGVHSGHKIIEVKPRGIHKGVVAEELIALHPSDFILAAGDDYTDEAMFQALPEDAYTIKVGMGETHARFRLPRVQNLLSLLEELTKR